MGQTYMLATTLVPIRARAIDRSLTKLLLLRAEWLDSADAQCSEWPRRDAAMPAEARSRREYTKQGMAL